MSLHWPNRYKQRKEELFEYYKLARSVEGQVELNQRIGLRKALFGRFKFWINGRSF
jgi:hypothetical protein